MILEGPCRFSWRTAFIQKLNLFANLRRLIHQMAVGGTLGKRQERIRIPIPFEALGCHVQVSNVSYH